MEQNLELVYDDMDFGRACDMAQYFHSESEDDMTDFGDFNPYGIPMGDMCDDMFNEVYNGVSITGLRDDMFNSINNHQHAIEFDLCLVLLAFHTWSKGIYLILLVVYQT